MRLPFVRASILACALQALELTTKSPNSSTCCPVYGSTKGKNSTVSVNLKVEGGESSAPLGYIIYEHGIEEHLGVVDGAPGLKHYFCTAELVGKSDCTMDNIGQLIHRSPNLAVPLTVSKWSEAEKELIGEFTVKHTGYYCVRVLNPTGTQIKITSSFTNAHGKLPAEYLPLMRMSFWMAAAYLAGLIAWAVLLFRHQNVVMDFQKYIAGMLGLSFAELSSYYLYYSSYNFSGRSSAFLLTMAALIGSIRMTAMLFILLIVSMGYGVVIPSLEDRAKPIYMLTLFYLIASVVYVFTSLTTRASGQIMLFLATLSITFGGGAFMTWTFDSLKTTCSLLLQRKQYAKLDMYQKLTALLKALYSATILFMAASIVFVAGSGTSQSWYAGHWDWLWFMTDGWQSLLNLVGILGAAYIFRPRPNNITAAMNQLASEPIDEDIESGGQLNMETFKIYETRLHKDRNTRENFAAFANTEDPDWAKPDVPLS